jgi:hypothetical protein
MTTERLIEHRPIAFAPSPIQETKRRIDDLLTATRRPTLDGRLDLLISQFALTVAPHYTDEKVATGWLPMNDRMHGLARWSPARRAWLLEVVDRRKPTPTTATRRATLFALFHELHHVVNRDLAKSDDRPAVALETVAHVARLAGGMRQLDPATDVRLLEFYAEREKACDDWATARLADWLGDPVPASPPAPSPARSTAPQPAGVWRQSSGVGIYAGDY